MIDLPHLDWLHDGAYFLGGAVLVNAIPHFVSGLMGRPFQESVRQAAGAGAVVLDGQRLVGRLQPG